MSPQSLHISTPQSSGSYSSIKDLTNAANSTFAQHVESFSEEGNVSPKSPLSFDFSGSSNDTECASRKKRKFSVSSMVDDIFSEMDESFFLQKQRSKVRRSMSRAKSYRSLLGGSDAIEKTDSKRISSESISSSAQQPTDQVNCDQGVLESSHESALNIYQRLFFPELSSQSANSCNVTSSLSSIDLRDTSASEMEGNSEKTSHYGWFVQTDDGDCNLSSCPNSSYSSPLDDLAFKAPTAPKRVNDNAELEWACAADTVDDVLGDLF